VKQWLVEKGIAPERIQTRGAGSADPIADNKTPAGRVKNRRIEFKILP
jgi:outer membrane protein OmpA-like peptidoglycan-associated protein